MAGKGNRIVQAMGGATSGEGLGRGSVALATVASQVVKFTNCGSSLLHFANCEVTSFKTKSGVIR
ncbi:hypothetical protein [Rubinisphaera sp.]|uniref:hypothetical protein n=1 Tax=Rubinisphaera sp. TaxID=2024857 RepID=UPI0025EB039B|nr:hypothetical protein [Rubinisphaera sp.]